ncbi:MAG: hypothetical protein O2819_08115 [Planctomycetota bacterium]|nr:hypothetical protein [Planctomycetota bacterium]MDA1106099.1 hypothetical protein [Planctomycetota bacterium]
MDSPSLFLPADEPMPWIYGWHWIVVGLLLTTGAWLGISRLRWFLLVRWNRQGRAAGDRKSRTTRACPRCHFDMRGTPSLRCSECGFVAASELALTVHIGLRRTEWTWLVACVGFFGWVSFIYSRDRGWSPPLPQWRLVETVALPNGSVVERYEERDLHAYNGQRCIVRPALGEPITLEGWRISLGSEDWHTKVVSGAGDTDITGDGVADIIIEDYSGGAHCCYTVWIFEAMPDGSMRQSLDMVTFMAHGFEDVNADGILELITADYAYAYAFTGYASLDYPTLIYAYRGGEYVLAPDLMQRTPLSRAALDTLCAEHASADWIGEPRQAFDALLSKMMELLYSDRSDQAWRLYDEACRVEEPVRTEWTNKFLEILRQSRYVGLFEDAPPTIPAP